MPIQLVQFKQKIDLVNQPNRPFQMNQLLIVDIESILEKCMEILLPHIIS